MPQLAQVGQQPWAPAGAPPAFGVATLEVATYRRVSIRAGVRLTREMIVEARAGDAEDPTQRHQWKLSPFTRDEGVLHLDSLAKNAVASF